MAGPRTTRLRHAGLAFLILTGCGLSHAGGQAPEVQRPLRQDAVVEIPSRGAEPIRVAVEIADDDREQAAGLMHRTLAGDGEGMLFVFPGAARRAFWMRNTPASLDLLFLSPELRLVAVVPNAEPMSDRVLSPKAQAQYVLEVRGGFTERHGVTLGAQLRIIPTQ
jgi:uncharacterized membrane protein (UPF0127 family)